MTEHETINPLICPVCTKPDGYTDDYTNSLGCIGCAACGAILTVSEWTLFSELRTDRDRLQAELDEARAQVTQLRQSLLRIRSLFNPGAAL